MLSVNPAGSCRKAKWLTSGKSSRPELGTLAAQPARGLARNAFFFRASAPHRLANRQRFQAKRKRAPEGARSRLRKAAAAYLMPAASVTTVVVAPSGCLVMMFWASSMSTVVL